MPSSDLSRNPVAVGLVGAGPWARAFHAPVLAAGPETTLAGVWSRRPQAAAALAAEFGVPACGDYAELLGSCEAVAFAVPPDVQARLAVTAARAGLALLLDKPVALTVDDAAALAAAVEEAGVVTQLVLTNRFRPAVREFLAQADKLVVTGARACQLTGEFLDGTFQHSPWRDRGGILYNTGPHGLDILDTALGPIEEIRAAGDPENYLALTCLHQGGAVSQLALSGKIPGIGRHTVYELYGPHGELRLDFRDLTGDSAQTRANLRAEFAAAVRTGVSHPIDVRRGLHLQRLMAEVLNL
ncbi:Gfo/Idh/MocA family oxidoreductase [Nonomuraea sp. NPDC005983]|uniref:Gfo/Idh/MocA family protein n=1 Tax=Nonomuraea sp. NPDC005983 TaxID=3155595 RepID=UPI0033B5B831